MDCNYNADLVGRVSSSIQSGFEIDFAVVMCR